MPKKTHDPKENETNTSAGSIKDTLANHTEEAQGARIPSRTPMRNQDQEQASNYLAKTTKSDYDNFFRRISRLANTWLDHNACINKNKQINILVQQIESQNLFVARPNSQSFLSSNELLLGQFIQAVFLLQDETQTGSLKSKLRKNLEKILNLFDHILLENPTIPKVDFNKLNSPKSSEKTMEKPQTSQTKKIALSNMTKKLVKLFNKK